MICFGAKTDQKVKQNGAYGSHFKTKQNKRIKKKWAQTAESKRYFFFLFSSLASLFDIRKSDRRNSSEQERKCSTR